MGWQKESFSLKALTMISGPMPAGSPIVMAIRAVCVKSQNPLFERIVFKDSRRLGDFPPQLPMKENGGGIEESYFLSLVIFPVLFPAPAGRGLAARISLLTVFSYSLKFSTNWMASSLAFLS